MSDYDSSTSTVTNFNSNSPVDRNVLSIINEFKQRSNKGFSKYGTTTERIDLSVDDWLQHLKEELMDACVYIQTIQSKL